MANATASKTNAMFITPLLSTVNCTFSEFNLKRFIYKKRAAFGKWESTESHQMRKMLRSTDDFLNFVCTIHGKVDFKHSPSHGINFERVLTYGLFLLLAFRRCVFCNLY